MLSDLIIASLIYVIYYDPQLQCPQIQKSNNTFFKNGMLFVVIPQLVKANPKSQKWAFGNKKLTGDSKNKKQPFISNAKLWLCTRTPYMSAAFAQLRKLVLDLFVVALCSGISHWRRPVKVLKAGGVGAECQQNLWGPYREPSRHVEGESQSCISMIQKLIRLSEICKRFVIKGWFKIES